MIKTLKSLPPIGMRNVKTAVSVGLCLLLLYPLGDITPLPACFSAIICMKDSVEESIKLGKARFIGTLIGGFVGLSIVFIDERFHNGLFLILLTTLGIMLTIYLCTMFKNSAGTVVACLVCCIVLISYENVARYEYAFLRVIETLLGILIAVVVNRVLPDYRRES